MPLTILITGANRGLGLEFCRQYLAAGEQVIAGARHPEQAEQLQELAEQYPQNLSIVMLDITQEQQHHALRQQLGEQKLDIVINNAGIYGPKGQPLEQIEADEWNRVFQVNAIAPILFTRNISFHLKQPAKVVFISSKMGSMGDNTSGGSYIYRSSKAALNAAARSYALDAQPHGVQVAILHPGWVQTAMGGPAALISPETSVAGLRQVISQLDADDSGEFIAYDGQPIPW